LKKIFAILLSLALVVSLGVLTAAPVAATTMPSISPTSATYDLDAKAQVTTTIKWGDATSVAITDTEGTLLTAGADQHYVIYGDAPSDSLLVITKKYLDTVLTYNGDSITLVLSFDVGICTFTITATKTSPGVSPTSATWVYGSDNAVSTTILWGPCTDTTISITGLASTDDYEVLGDLLVIKANYLGNSTRSGIDGVGDYKTLTVLFYEPGPVLCGAAVFTVVATGDNPTISPTSRTWRIGSGAVVTTTITFNSATSLDEIRKGAAVVAEANYELFGTLLVIDDDYVDDFLLNEGDSIALTLDFDLGTCLFTISATGLDVPSVSPESATWELGNCDDDVTTTINYAGVANDIDKIQDVTVATVPIDLVKDLDYSLVGNTLTFFACLNATARATSEWDGLECVLDADVHQTRIIEITFNDDPPTVVEFAVSTTGFTAPSLSSTALIYDLDLAGDPTYSYSGALITWGDATGIEYISQLDEDGNVACNLTPDPTPPYDLNLGGGIIIEEGVIVPVGNYMVAYNAAYGGWLVLFIKLTYLQLPSFNIATAANITAYPWTFPNVPSEFCGANLQEIGDEVKVVIHWSPMNDTCGVGGEGTSYDDKFPATVVTITAVGTSASISPSKGEYNIDDPGNVTAEIDWGPHATTIVTDGITCGFDTLVEGTDYLVDPDTGDEDTPSTLTIMADYLADALENVGDTVVLDVDFNTGEDGKLTIEAVGTPLCFIATAAYGTPEAEEISIIREFRDVVMRPNKLGAELVSLYYETSPPIAEFISQNEALRTAVRVGFIDPIVAILNWSHGLWS